MLLGSNFYGMRQAYSGRLLKYYRNITILHTPHETWIIRDNIYYIQIASYCHNISNIDKFIVYPVFYDAILFAYNETNEFYQKIRKINISDHKF